jgi:hypothetical protein
MLKKKLIAAGIASIGALVLSVPAMATSSFSNKNYSGRYACHEDDGAGATSYDTNVTAGLGGGVGNLTTTYVVNPEGNGYYASGSLILNFSILFGDNPCTFTLDTSTSSYYVDYNGIVHEYQNWTDDTTGSSADYCSGASFYHEIEGSLALLTQAASETKTTANTDLAWIGLDFAGSGDCVLSGT